MRLFLQSIALVAIASFFVACGDEDKLDGNGETEHGDHDHGDEDGGSTHGTDPKANFFVSSDTSATGNLGGLDGADARCTRLAGAVGMGGEWRAYLSTESAEGGAGRNARDRIGTGPFYNVNGVELAADLDALHDRKGDPDVFIDERGEKIPGQWEGSPAGVVHDILTGSAQDGTVLAGKTCANWTSESAELAAQVGHSDGLGPAMNGAAPFSSWNSSHENGGCNDTAPRGGAGRIYCFKP